LEDARKVKANATHGGDAVAELKRGRGPRRPRATEVIHGGNAVAELMKTPTLHLAASPTNAVPKANALHTAAPIVLALQECDEELRREALELFAQLNSGKLDEHERFTTTALLTDILFPTVDHAGSCEVDLEEVEASPEAAEAGARMDREETTFAERLLALMTEKGLTQAELASKVGIGQPAVSMMINRACRPQRRTVVRLAEALGVTPDLLWPDFRK
jgi:lambda repressor-like predicted transcriptional regulator